MSLMIIGKNGMIEYKYLENRKAKMDFYKVIINTPGVKIQILPHQLPPKGWATPSHPKLIPHRQSKRGKKEPKRLGNIIPSNIIKYVKL